MTHDSREILTRCQSMLLRFCQAQANTYIAASSEYLFQQAEQASGNEAQRCLFEARQAIQDQHETLPRLLDQTVTGLFEQLIDNKSASANASTGNKQNEASELESELSLIENDEMELKVAISSMSHRAEADCAEALFALAQRMAVLNNGVKLASENNPFSPMIFCDTLVQLIETLQLDIKNRLILLKLFDRYFLKSMSGIYTEINQYLIDASILPNLRYKSDKKRPIEPKRRSSDTASIDQSEERQAELFDVIRSILEGNQQPINPQLPVVPVERLVAELSALQSQQLMRFQESSLIAAPRPQLPSSNLPSHQQAIECVGILFDYILNDNTLPDSVKSLLSHLHTPLLKLSLLDQSFLSDPKHDARQLVNSLIGAGEHWVSPEGGVKNDVYPQMQEVVKRIIAEFGHDNDNSTKVFGEATTEFNRYIEKVEQKAQISEQRSVQAAKGKETLEMGRAKVDALVKEKLQDEPLPKPIVQLISDPWSAFLSYTLLRHGENSQDWNSAVDVIDSLLWYIEPKINAEEVQLANALRKDLTAAVEHGLTSVGLDPSEIQQHLRALEMCSKLATENANKPKADPHTLITQANVEELVEPVETNPIFTETYIDQIDTPEQTNEQTLPIYETGLDTFTAEQNPATPAPKKRPPNVTDSHLSGKKPSQSTSSSSDSKTADAQPFIGDTAELVKLSDVLANNSQSIIEHANERASEKEIKAVLSLEFGTWLDWRKTGEPERKLKLTWYNQTTQNCMLSNQMGQQVAVLPANDIALGIAQGWINLSDTRMKKPFFERMLETVVDQLRVNSKTA